MTENKTVFYTFMNLYVFGVYLFNCFYLEFV